jgi:acyl-ACP thioesterase
MRIRLKTMKMKIKRLSHLKKRITIKGEIKSTRKRKMSKKFRVKDRHTQGVHQAIQMITP